MTRCQRFGFACVFEVSLLLLAALVSWWFRRPLWVDFRWDWEGLAVGTVAATPIFGVLWWVLTSRTDAAQVIRQFLAQAIGPFFHDFAWWQLAALSLIAGVSEEVLFRGLVQGGLTPVVGEVPALLIAGALFALAHLVTWTYAALTLIVGAYLGLLWMISGNLLVPIVAHSLYDFVALIYLSRELARAKHRCENQGG